MSYSVLIVDDSPAMRGFIRRTLQLSGLPLKECLDAGNGLEALAVLAGRQVDLILTDINMPGMNGEQLLERIEADAALKDIPVVVVSTDATERRIERMRALGARGYLTKPFFPELLRTELEDVLEASHE